MVPGPAIVARPDASRGPCPPAWASRPWVERVSTKVPRGAGKDAWGQDGRKDAALHDQVGIFVIQDEVMADERSFPRLRPSVSHAASRQAEIDRVRRMTVEERVKAALGLAARFAALRPSPREA